MTWGEHVNSHQYIPPIYFKQGLFFLSFNGHAKREKNNTENASGISNHLSLVHNIKSVFVFKMYVQATARQKATPRYRTATEQHIITDSPDTEQTIHLSTS